MPLRLSFFDDPLVRLTPPSALNDPFDSKPTEIGIEKKLSFFMRHNEESNPEKLREIYKNDLETGLNQYGIISLTEDPHNLLMWSHYADEHRGLIISLTCDGSTFDYHDRYTENCEVSQTTPARVSYSSRRPGHDLPDNAIYEYFESGFYTHYALTKGDNWIYEKEHRYILNLWEADAAIVDVNSLEWVSNQKNDEVSLTHLGGNTYKAEAVGRDNRRVLTWWLAYAKGKEHISSVRLFKRIKPESLVGIYLGCRVTHEEERAIIERIEKSERFSKTISIYKGKENRDRFELDFELLN